MSHATLEPSMRTQARRSIFVPLHWPRLADTGALLSLAAIWILLSAEVNPLGDFPLNDDWSFGRSVFNLVGEGRFQLTGWMSMTFVVQLFWGALFCLPLGFSFTALRISTLIAGLVGLAATYLLLRDANPRRRTAALGSLVLAVNPLYFHPAHTFMTDVPFTALSIVSLLFFARAMRGGSLRNVVLGTMAACAATLVRQVGIAIPMGFALSLLVLNQRSLKNALLAMGPVIVVGGMLVTYNVCLARWVGVPALYHLPISNLQSAVSENGLMVIGVVVSNACVALFYLGLFSLPFTLAFLPRLAAPLHSAHHRVAAVVAVAAFVLLNLACFVGFAGLPLIGNILHEGGLGPMTLRDTYLLGMKHWPHVPFLRAGVTVAGTTGAAVLIYTLLRSLMALMQKKPSRFEARERVALFALAVGFVYLAPIALGGFYERYLLLLIPLAMLAVSSLRQTVVPEVSSRLRLPRAALIAGLTVLYAAFSVAATHDYLAWNRARWQAVRWLVKEQGIPLTKLDGGAEVNGWYLYRPEYEAIPGKSWWWVEDDEYLLAFGAVDGYSEDKAVGFTRWFPPGKGRVVVLRRTP